jgi:hypothetical protein
MKKFRRLVVIGIGLTGLVTASGGNAAGLVDPTRPMGAVTSSSPRGYTRPTGPVLQSTMVSAKRRIAVISGRRYTVGDKVGSAEIVEIRSYEVVLKRGGRISYLRLMPALTKDNTS